MATVLRYELSTIISASIFSGWAIKTVKTLIDQERLNEKINEDLL